MIKFIRILTQFYNEIENKDLTTQFFSKFKDSNSFLNILSLIFLFKYLYNFGV